MQHWGIPLIGGSKNFNAQNFLTITYGFFTSLQIAFLLSLQPKLIISWCFNFTRVKNRNINTWTCLWMSEGEMLLSTMTFPKSREVLISCFSQVLELSVRRIPLYVNLLKKWYVYEFIVRSLFLQLSWWWIGRSRKTLPTKTWIGATGSQSSVKLVKPFLYIQPTSSMNNCHNLHLQFLLFLKLYLKQRIERIFLDHKCKCFIL